VRTPTSATTSRAAEAGFTLIEVLAAVVILALALGSVTLRLSRPSDRLTLDALAAETASRARAARDAAMRSGRDSILRVDLGRRIIAAESGKPVTFPEDVTITVLASRADTAGGISDIRFFPDGSSTGGVIRLGGAGGQHEIRINWFTGRVRIEPAT
jgi:general secretion pathway protein H